MTWGLKLSYSNRDHNTTLSIYKIFECFVESPERNWENLWEIISTSSLNSPKECGRSCAELRFEIAFSSGSPGQLFLGLLIGTARRLYDLRVFSGTSLAGRRAWLVVDLCQTLLLLLLANEGPDDTYFILLMLLKLKAKLLGWAKLH